MSTTVSNGNGTRITRDDLKSKLGEIQDEANRTVETAKSQIVAIGVVVGAVVVLAVFALGRRAGRRKNTVIEIKRN